MLIAAAVGLPWYVQMYLRHGAPFIDRLIMHDMYKRAFVHVHDTNAGDDTSFRYYIWQLGYGLFPWTGLATGGLLWSLRRPDRTRDRQGDAAASMLVWLVAIIIDSIFDPVVNVSMDALLQAKVPPDLQGRVFAARTIIAWLTFPISPIIGGTLADYVLEPVLRDTGFTALVPPGPGAGMALLIIVCNLVAILFSQGMAFVPAIRNAEDILPDHDQAPADRPRSVRAARTPER